MDDAERNECNKMPHKVGWFSSATAAKTQGLRSRLLERFPSAGATPFLDEADVEVGEDFEEEIRQSLERADELVVLLTPWALERPYVWAEIGAAWLRRIPVVGILYGVAATELQARPGIPVFLKRRDFVDINSIDAYFQQLMGRVDQGPTGVEDKVP